MITNIMQLTTRTQHKSKHRPSEGFSLIETAIALTTLGVCLAYALPLFLYSKVSNSKNEVRTGGLIVAQRAFDEIRSKSIKDLPNSGNEVIDENTTDPIKKEKITAIGKPYTRTIYYCERDCSSTFRSFRVEIKRQGEKVYELEGSYTEFGEASSN